MKNLFFVFLFILGFSSLALSAEDKNVVVDQAIGGMEQGRRISAPGSYSSTGVVSGNSGSVANPVTDAHAHPFSQTTGNRGYINTGANGPQNAINRSGGPQANGASNVSTVTSSLQAGQTVTAQVTNPSGASSNPIVSVETGTNPGSNTVHNVDVTTQPVTGTTGQTVPEQTGGSVNVNTGEEAHGNGGILTGGETSTVNAPTGTTTQEPSSVSGTSNNPIVSVEAGTNPGSSTPNATVHTDTSGQLEDRQIVSAGVAGAVTGSTGVQVGSASEITGSNTVHNTNVTTQPVTGTTGQTVPEQTGGSVNVNPGEEAHGNGGILTGGETSTVNAPTGTTTQEPSGTSGNPIVGVEANTNPASGTPNASVHTDTSGQLEDRQIVSAGVAGAVTGSTGTQVGSASEITGSTALHNADVTNQPVTGTIGQTVPEQTGGSVVENHGYVTGQAGTVETVPVGSTPTGSTQEPSGTSGTSNNPIIAVEANANPSSGTTPNASVHTDTSGQLEDRQIVDAGITGQTGSTQVEEGSATDVTGQELVQEADITTEQVPGTGSTVPGQTSTGSGTTAQEPSGTSGNPIVAVETGTNPESATPSVGASVDTTGEIEDKQFLQTDLASEGVTSPGQVGSASNVTGSSTVHGANVTTQPQTGSSGSGTTTQEPSGTSNNPIVSVEAGTNPSSGTPNASVHTDTSGQLEDRQIVDAGITGQAGSSGTQVGSASEITGSGTIGGLDVTTQPMESVIPAPSDMSTEIDTTGQTVGGAADVGVQADSSGISDTSDVAKKDSADGLNLGTTVHTGL